MIYPSAQKVEIDGTASFTCSLTDAHWVFSKTKSIDNATKLPRGKGIVIEQVGLKDAGYYFCFGIHHKNKKQFFGTAELKVYGENEILHFDM